LSIKKTRDLKNLLTYRPFRDKRDGDKDSKEGSQMDIALSEGVFVSSILIILLIVARLNRAVKLLNNRVNIHSSLLKKLKKSLAEQGEAVERADVEEALKEILDREFR
jgi:hypothetical protein